QLHGCFTVAIWEGAGQRLTLANDRYGMRPLYWTQLESGALVFAADVDALLAHSGVDDAPSIEGIGQLFCFGQLLGESTLYDRIHALPGAALLTWEARSPGVRLGSYAPPADREPARTEDEWLDELDARIGRAVREACNNTGRLGLSLSGGLDARTILAL